MRRMSYLPIPSEYSLSCQSFCTHYLTVWLLPSVILVCVCTFHFSAFATTTYHDSVVVGDGWWGDRVEKISFSADNNRYVESSIKCHSSKIQWRKSERGQWEWAHVHNRTIALTGPVTYQPHLSYPGYDLAQVNLMTHTHRTWFVCYAAVKRHFRDTPSTSLFLFSSHNSIGYTFTILLAP